ncbi:MAG: hypothetical protein CMC43_06685 [Flavobacteriaceae bacterium]|nr:hypothetical protein [Flavobacteriaceae bacterium]|tara:strand:+ start:163 stop:915 length:753 start_codon:yes stop_codon:yes gene_type:complete
MAYNNLSGTVLLPNELLKVEGLSTGIVSGNLSTSDGAQVINVPRVSNATNNAILTNLDGNANTLTCESNLTFDGDTLNVVGEITASTGVSASFFMGDGSRLTGINAGGSGAGIFTEASTNQAFTTSSVQIGSDSAPTKTLSVAGSSFLSGAVIHKRHSTGTNYEIRITDFYIGANSLNGTIRLTLPTASTTTNGQTFVIKDEGGNADNNNITISCSVGGDKIDGQNLIILESPYASVQVYCNGTSKYYIT